MSAGFLGRLQVLPRSFSFSFRRALMGSDVTEALPDRKFLDFGGALVSSAGFVVAMQFAVARLLVALAGKLSAISGTPRVVLRDDLRAASAFRLRSSSSARWAALFRGESAMTRH